MIFKLKLGTLTGYFKYEDNKVTVLEDDKKHDMFCPTSSFEISMTEEERAHGIENTIGWPEIAIALPKGEIQFFPGLGVIYGASGAGKTQLLNFVYKKLKVADIGVRRIMFNEPDLLVSEKSAAIVSETQLLYEIAEFICSDDKILFIDSIRAFIYSGSGGATGKGGIDMTMYTKLTELSILAQVVGKSINVVFNPISADTAVVENIKEAVKGSVESLYFIEKEKRTLNMESRNCSAKRELITVSFDPGRLAKSLTIEERPEFVFEEKLREGIVGPLSHLARRNINRSLEKTGF